jgi:predicted naringenin-chalcone synthase
MIPVLGNFIVKRPQFEVAQHNALNWISQAHALAKYNENINSPDCKSLEKINYLMNNYVNRFACGPEKISNRGTSISDFMHTNWDEMQLFNLKNNNCSPTIKEKMLFFNEIAGKVFEDFYSEVNVPPKNIIHVTCTGYSSPSAAQILVSNMGWGDFTKIYHAYHMGCYAALPALRVAQGYLLQDNIENALISSIKGRVDIVHTELCTLHFNPNLHDPGQFVVQSLFADGFIYYSLFEKNAFYRYGLNKGLQILATHEVIISHTVDAMSWDLSESGFYMSLSGKVPAIIAENIFNFIEKLFSKTEYNFSEIKDIALYAVHPGGPKIIKLIKDVLNLSDKSIEFSELILKNFGNMSSATLPHIWNEILNSKVQAGTLVISLAFGPGLTVVGSVMRII